MLRSRSSGGFGRRLLIPVTLAVALMAAACGSSNSTPHPTSAVGGASQAASGAAAGASDAAGASGVAGASGGAASVSAGSSSNGQGGGQSAGAGSGSGSAVELQSQMVSVIKKVNPSVVLIETSQGLGSGVVFDSKGDIVTNAHVAGSATAFKVTLSSGKTYDGTLVGSFPPDDIAVIKVSGAQLTPATFGDSAALDVGDVVLAMGNPLGLQSSVTQGIVSALGRTVSEPTGNALPDVIQTSAPINPGNSGGALVNLDGEVVGIPTLAASDPQMGGAASGIGFAISSNRATYIASQLIQSGKVTNSGRAFLGVTLADTTSGQGVLVYGVQSGGPAAKAGIQAGDLIVAVNGTQTPDDAALSQALVKLHPGDAAKVDVIHQDGSHATIDVTLGQMAG